MAYDEKERGHGNFTLGIAFEYLVRNKECSAANNGIETSTCEGFRERMLSLK